MFDAERPVVFCEICALTIRLKTLVILAITSIGLISVLYGASRFFLLREFIAIEQASARENAERARNTFYDEIASLLERTLREGQELGVVADGDARLLGYLTLGAIKELLFQVVLRGAEYEPELLVDAIFAFLGEGYLRAGAATRRKVTSNARRSGRT